MDVEVVDSLNKLASILKLVHRDALARTRSELRAEPAKAAILDAIGAEWLGTKALQTKVAKATALKERAIQQHIADLVSLGAVERRGDACNTEYRNSGIL